MRASGQKTLEKTKGKASWGAWGRSMAKGIRILRATNYTTPQSFFAVRHLAEPGEPSAARLIALRPGELQGSTFPNDCCFAEYGQVQAHRAVFPWGYPRSNAAQRVEARATVARCWAGLSRLAELGATGAGVGAAAAGAGLPNCSGAV